MLSGFQTGEFLMAVMSFLPVMRRFLVEKLPLKEAMEAYEAVEAIALKSGGGSTPTEDVAWRGRPAVGEAMLPIGRSMAFPRKSAGGGSAARARGGPGGSLAPGRS